MRLLESPSRHQITREELRKGVMATVRRMRVTTADPTVIEQIRARQVYEHTVAYRAQNDSPWCKH